MRKMSALFSTILFLTLACPVLGSEIYDRALAAWEGSESIDTLVSFHAKLRCADPSHSDVIELPAAGFTKLADIVAGDFFRVQYTNWGGFPQIVYLYPAGGELKSKVGNFVLRKLKSDEAGEKFIFKNGHIEICWTI